MNSKIFWQLNEAYQLGVCAQEVAEEIHSSEELTNIKEWVEALIEEGYDLDQYTDEELCEAYLEENISRSQALAKADKNFKYPSHQKVDRKIDKLINSDDPNEVERGFKIHGTLATIRSKSSINKSARNISRGPGPRRAKVDAEKDMKASGYMSEELDLYDIVSEYLVSEGYCDSYEDADVIMVNMSEEWRESVLDEVTGGGYVPRSGTTYSTDYRSSAQTRRDKHMSTPWSDRSGAEKSRQSAGIKSRTAVGSREEIPSRDAGGSARSPRGAESGLAMTPQKRMETRAKSLELKGKTKQANKIRSVLDRP
jgi:hypothetical protein